MGPFDENGKFTPQVEIDLGEITYPAVDVTERSTYRLAKDDPKRLAKLASCMMPWLVFDAYTGLYREVHRPCGYHQCPICSKLYAKQYRERLINAGTVYYMITDRETATNICRLIANKTYFLRMPTETEDYLFFRLDDDYVDNVEFISLTASKQQLSPAIIDALPMEELQAVPDNRRISGKLGLEPVLEDEGLAVIVNVPMVHITTEAPDMNARKYKAMLTAMTYTVNEAPKTGAELQGALYRRLNSYTNALDADHIKHEIIYAKVKVNIAKVNWWMSSLHTIELMLKSGVKSGSNFLSKMRAMVAGWGALAKRRVEIYISSLNLNHDDDIVIGLRGLLAT